MSCYNLREDKMNTNLIPGGFHEKAAPYTEQTKNNLRIAFWSLYAQKPIEKISIKEITELAGYNRGTFYLYYNDVYDLLHQIEEEILGKITDVLNDSLEKNDTFDLSGQMGILLDLMPDI